MKKYNKEDEKVISTDIGYPYNIIPKGFPNKISNEKIQETINKVLDNMKGNAGVGNLVLRDSVFINLGLTELNSRHSKKQSKMNFWFSLIAIIIALVALLV